MTPEPVTWLHDQAPSNAPVPETPDAWDAFARAACESGLAGPVLERAPSLGIALAAPARTALQDRAARVGAWNLNALNELERVLVAFEADDVPVMLLKGAALLHTAYDRPHLRPMSDLDLLVRPEDAGRALRALERAGCRRGFDLLRDDFFPRFHCEVEFHTAAPRPVRIDLHAAPFHPLRYGRLIPAEQWWSGALELAVGRTRALLPAPETMLIHLAAHAAFHGCSRDTWLYDLERFVKWCDGGGRVHRRSRGESPVRPDHGDGRTCTGPLDWGRLLRLCRPWGLGPAVHTAFDAAQARFGTFVPAHVMDRLAAERGSWRDRLALWAAPRAGRSAWIHVGSNLLTVGSPLHALRYLLALALPGRAHLGSIYPHRHLAWPLCAHAWRLLRHVPRPRRRRSTAEAETNARPAARDRSAQ